MKKVITIILFIFIIIGIGILLYPVISNLINSYYNTSNIKEYNKIVRNLTEDDEDKILNKAKEYNEAIATSSYDNGISNYGYKYKKTIKSYDSILNFGNSLIGYIEIPTLNVNLPIYHSDLKDVLTKGAAHMKGTSFPIGGNGTHAVISAHSGYPQQKFFDDIDEMKKGDYFIITILNKKLVYKVIDINIVKPSDTSHTKIQQEKDLITLVTCYPYGINSHRLLVTAERETDNKIIKQSQKVADNRNINRYDVFITPILLFVIYISIFKIKYKKAKIIYKNEYFN